MEVCDEWANRWVVKPAVRIEDGAGIIMRLLGFWPLAISALACNGAPPPKFPLPDGQTALDRLRATYACSRGVGGEAKIEVFSSEGRHLANVSYTVMLPELMRITAFSGSVGIVSELASNGTEFTLIDRRNKVVRKGPVNACSLERYAGIPVPPFVLVQLLRGEAPVLVHDASAATIDWVDGQYVVRIASKHDAHEEVHLAPHPDDWNKPWRDQRLRVLEVRVVQSGYEHYHAKLSDHAPARSKREPACSADVPRKLQIRIAEGELDLSLRSSDLDQNPRVYTGTFNLTTPRGVPVRFEECSDAPQVREVSAHPLAGTSF
jgi:hypothetical protein